MIRRSYVTVTLCIRRYSNAQCAHTLSFSGFYSRFTSFVFQMLFGHEVLRPGGQRLGFTEPPKTPDKGVAMRLCRSGTRSMQRICYHDSSSVRQTLGTSELSRGIWENLTGHSGLNVTSECEIMPTLFQLLPHAVNCGRFCLNFLAHSVCHFFCLCMQHLRNRWTDLGESHPRKKMKFRCQFLLSGALSVRKLTPAKVKNTTHFYFRLY